ncbi:hypothetical protein C8N40_11191 [Pontibacter mucosus]|uniref:Uncharacterized protein n=1 Tax=Pontibacter mucosus TaxID=1649266 RepID=A0A2T5YD33_9BACT|nr:hypothetical protein [Pontibacter mucosus]PTX14426.1 hypothetical protein C8N40_11191 [Pontibacter mucosus]
MKEALPEPEKAQIIGEPMGARYFSLYNNGDLSVPVAANCPIENLERAKSIYGENFTIRLHITKETYP